MEKANQILDHAAWTTKDFEEISKDLRVPVEEVIDVLQKTGYVQNEKGEWCHRAFLGQNQPKD